MSKAADISRHVRVARDRPAGTEGCHAGRDAGPVWIRTGASDACQVINRLCAVVCRTHTSSLSLSLSLSLFCSHLLNDKAPRETQTLRAGCSKPDPKNFAPPETPFPGARDGQNLISWRWSLPSPTDPIW